MIELKNNQLIISFPEVHPDAKASIHFQRTLRVPDDDSDYRLPPGMGSFDFRHIEDYANKLPSEILEENENIEDCWRGIFAMFQRKFGATTLSGKVWISPNGTRYDGTAQDQ